MALARELRLLTRTVRVEHGALLDVTTIHRFGEILVGQLHEVDFAPLLPRAEQTGHQFVQIHTHPSLQSFSPDDVRLLVYHAFLRHSVVIDAEDNWYLLSRVIGRPTVDVGGVRLMWEATAPKARSTLLQQALRGEIPVERQQTLVPHLVWSQIAELLGLQYDLVEGLE